MNITIIGSIHERSVAPSGLVVPLWDDSKIIQDVVLFYALQKQGFSIYELQIEIAIFDGSLLTYKQVRNALYRLRDMWPIIHLGAGVYVVSSQLSS